MYNIPIFKIKRLGEQMRVIRQRGHNRIPLPLKIILSVTLIVGMSFSLAWVWHTTQQSVAAENIQEPQPADSPSVPPEDEAPAVSQVTVQTADLPEESDAEQSGEAEQPEDAGQTVFDGAVPKSDPVGQSYFDDAIFIGDSISTGIPLYHLADNAAVVAMTGINTDNINYKEVIDRISVGLEGEGRVTFIEAAKQYVPRSKVYIMLGGNGIGFDKETFIDGYETFLGSVREVFPDAIIYLQSMTPVTADYVNEFDPELNNAKIDDYNLEIMALAKRFGAYYLDVASALKDETGALPKEASPLDGMHFSPEYYNKWFDYLKTHAIKDEVKK